MCYICEIKKALQAKGIDVKVVRLGSIGRDLKEGEVNEAGGKMLWIFTAETVDITTVEDLTGKLSESFGRPMQFTTSVREKLANGELGRLLDFGAYDTYGDAKEGHDALLEKWGNWNGLDESLISTDPFIADFNAALFPSGTQTFKRVFVKDGKVETVTMRKGDPAEDLDA